MPIMTGLELSKKIKNLIFDNTHKNCKIVLHSGIDTDEYKQEIIDSHIDEILPKGNIDTNITHSVYKILYKI